uniref:SJCHGC09818 protein n=1 Tax=Schistosoma japonicum TaxID=6182 RepID=Q3KTD8_SCHJA|nr:SJCHGC09818 protein [Schistosoma japonicum]
MILKVWMPATINVARLPKNVCFLQLYLRTLHEFISILYECMNVVKVVVLKCMFVSECCLFTEIHARKNRMLVHLVVFCLN